MPKFYLPVLLYSLACLLLWQIHPEMRDLMDTMNRLSILPAEYEGKVKVQEWYVVIIGYQKWLHGTGS